MRTLTEAELDVVAGGMPGPDDDPYHFARKGSNSISGFGDGSAPPATPIIPPELLWRDNMFDKPPPDPDGPSSPLEP